MPKEGEKVRAALNYLLSANERRNKGPSWLVINSYLASEGSHKGPNSGAIQSSRHKMTKHRTKTSVM